MSWASITGKVRWGRTVQLGVESVRGRQLLTSAGEWEGQGEVGRAVEGCEGRAFPVQASPHKNAPRQSSFFNPRPISAKPQHPATATRSAEIPEDEGRGEREGGGEKETRVSREAGRSGLRRRHILSPSSLLSLLFTF